MVSPTATGLLDLKPLHLPIRGGGLDLTAPVVLAPNGVLPFIFAQVVGGAIGLGLATVLKGK